MKTESIPFNYIVLLVSSKRGDTPNCSDVPHRRLRTWQSASTLWPGRGHDANAARDQDLSLDGPSNSRGKNSTLLWGQGSDSGQPKPQEANWGWRMENNGNSVGSSGNSCRVIKEVLVSGDSFPGGKPKARKGGINKVSQRSRTRRQTCPASWTARSSPADSLRWPPPPSLCCGPWMLHPCWSICCSGSSPQTHQHPNAVEEGEENSHWAHSKMVDALQRREEAGGRGRKQEESRTPQTTERALKLREIKLSTSLPRVDGISMYFWTLGQEPVCEWPQVLVSTLPCVSHNLSGS